MKTHAPVAQIVMKRDRALFHILLWTGLLLSPVGLGVLLLLGIFFVPKKAYYTHTNAPVPPSEIPNEMHASTEPRTYKVWLYDLSGESDKELWRANYFRHDGYGSTKQEALEALHKQVPSTREKPIEMAPGGGASGA